LNDKWRAEENTKVVAKKNGRHATRKKGGKGAGPAGMTTTDWEDGSRHLQSSQPEKRKSQKGPDGVGGRFFGRSVWVGHQSIGRQPPGKNGHYQEGGMGGSTATADNGNNS